MRNLLPVSAGLVVFMGVVSGTLWFQLRENRQQLAEMRDEMTQLKASVAGAMRPEPLAEASQSAAGTQAMPVVAIRVPGPEPLVAPAALPQSVAPEPLAPRPVPRSEESVRAEVMYQSDQTATARVLAWKDRLVVAGLTLTTGQLQALDTAMRSELRRETEETLEIGKRNVPLDPMAAARLREETINRQNETNLRVLRAAASQLTPEQMQALRTQFESGHAARLASVHAEIERIASGQ